jgi:hypothetical protein
VVFTSRTWFTEGYTRDGSGDCQSRMGLIRSNWRVVRMAFIVSLFALEFGWRQPILFVIGYLDAALLLVFFWVLYALVRKDHIPR